MTSLSGGLKAWRQHGPVRGTARALRFAARKFQGQARGFALSKRPLQVGRDEVAHALGSHGVVPALRGAVLEAMPTVAAFERTLDRMEGPRATALVERADRVRSHVFDLLGSGPVDLGREIDWARDFKSGRRWPMSHISRVRIEYPDGSDIKVPWELSRFQHLPLLAAAYRLSREDRYLDEIGAQLDSWIAANPVEFGPNWACTMDVAIRGANWIAGLALVAEEAADRPWLDRAVASLLLHGRFIRSHLETAPVRGNHYLSDVVGLLPLAALFRDSDEGRSWAAWAASELIEEMQHQVLADGCDDEGSIGYHRLVAELFVCGAQAVEALVPGALPRRFSDRLERMLAFVAGYTRPDGLAPQIGDADDGRFLPLGDYGACDSRSHWHLFHQAGVEPPTPVGSVAYPDGGYYVMRAGEMYAIVRCGDTGTRGRGDHGHNDQLSFELCVDRQPVIVDPGAYVYTADPDSRNLFRSTGFHSTVRIDGAEQNPLPVDDLFSLPDRTRARALRFETSDGVVIFEGAHHGYERLKPAAAYSRRIELDANARELRIVDVVESSGAHDLEWTFPVAGGDCVRAGGDRCEVILDECRIAVEAPGVDLAIENGWYSPHYGVREQVPFIRGRARSRPGRQSWQFRLAVLVDQ